MADNQPRTKNTEWFQIAALDRDIFAIVEPGHVNSFLVKGKKLAAMIDTGMGFSDIRTAIEPLVDTDIVVLNTHWHYDHTGGNRLFAEIGISGVEHSLLEKTLPNDVLMEKYIRPCMNEGVPFPENFIPEAYEVKGSIATFSIRNGEFFDLGGRCLEAVATPGHTHGSMSFLDSLTGSLFCGDFIYQGPIYAHLHDSDSDEYIDSLQKIWHRCDDLNILYAAHNAYVLPKMFIASVLDGFFKIKANAVRAHRGYGLEKDVLAYSFGAFDILTKGPGSEGINIFSSDPA